MKVGDLVHSRRAFYALKYGSDNDWVWFMHPCIGVIVCAEAGMRRDPDTDEPYTQVLLCDKEKSGLYYVTARETLFVIP